MKQFKNNILIASAMLFALIFSGCDMYSYVTPVSQTRYENPQWAPPYYQGVRYYYLPDIEAYYDLSSRQFVYLSNGRWYDSSECPSIYAGFDLNDCFAIALNVNVYQPWMHHQYYVSHYPRYYYRDYYDHSNIPYVRGFNENSRSAIYWPESQRSRARSWDSEGLKSNRQFKYTPDDRKQQYNWSNRGGATRSTDNNNGRNSLDNWNGNTTNARSANSDNVYQKQGEKNNNENSNRSMGGGNANRQPQNNGNTNAAPTRSVGTETNSRQQQGANMESTKITRSTNYYGRIIGQPVKVEKQMRQQPRNLTNGGQNNRSSSNRSDQNNQDRK